MTITFKRDPPPAAQLRQPAYANRVHAMRVRGEAPQLAVWVVDGWAPVEDHLGQFGDWLVIVPDDTPVDLMDFRCLCGLQVFIQAPTRLRARAIAKQVAKFFPRQIWAYPEDERRLEGLDQLGNWIVVAPNEDRLTYSKRRAA